MIFLESWNPWESVLSPTREKKQHLTRAIHPQFKGQGPLGSAFTAHHLPVRHMAKHSMPWPPEVKKK